MTCGYSRIEMVRTRYVFFATVLLIACGSSSESSSSSGPDAGTEVDAGSTPGGGDEKDAGAEPDGSADAGPGPQFRIETPDMPVGSGQETTWCYFFRTPNAEPLGVRRWTLTIGETVQSAVAFTTPTDRRPAGTLSQVADCSIFYEGSGPAHWLLGTHAPSAELVTPPDDGTGRPVAFELPTSTAGFIMVHLLNTSDADKTTKVELTAEALPIGTRYTKTAPFMAYNDDIEVPMATTGDLETKDCAVPAGAKFWHVTTRTHKRATRASVKDGTATVVETTDWTKPEAKLWTSPFYTFGSGSLTSECMYDNDSNFTVRTGPSMVRDEECIAVGHFFPALDAVYCGGKNM